MKFYQKIRTLLHNRHGSIPVGLLFFIFLIATAVWFFKNNNNNAIIPKLPSLKQTRPETQKLPPATGVEFSTESQTPEKQAKKYYRDQQGHR